VNKSLNSIRSSYKVIVSLQKKMTNPQPRTLINGWLPSAQTTEPLFSFLKQTFSHKVSQCGDTSLYLFKGQVKALFIMAAYFKGREIAVLNI